MSQWFYFNSWAAFFAMGEHGFYIWLAYSLFVLVVLYNCIPWFYNHKRKRIKQ